MKLVTGIVSDKKLWRSFSILTGKNFVKIRYSLKIPQQINLQYFCTFFSPRVCYLSKIRLVQHKDYKSLNRTEMIISEIFIFSSGFLSSSSNALSKKISESHKSKMPFSSAHSSTSIPSLKATQFAMKQRRLQNQTSTKFFIRFYFFLPKIKSAHQFFYKIFQLFDDPAQLLQNLLHKFLRYFSFHLR